MPKSSQPEYERLLTTTKVKASTSKLLLIITWQSGNGNGVAASGCGTGLGVLIVPTAGRLSTALLAAGRLSTTWEAFATPLEVEDAAAGRRRTTACPRLAGMIQEIEAFELSVAAR